MSDVYPYTSDSSTYDIKDTSFCVLVIFNCLLWCGDIVYMVHTGILFPPIFSVGVVFGILSSICMMNTNDHCNKLKDVLIYCAFCAFGISLIFPVIILTTYQRYGYLIGTKKNRKRRMFEKLAGIPDSRKI